MRQPAARQRTVRTEGRDDGRSARPQSLKQALPVSDAVLGVGQEVEDRAVVPDVHPGNRPLPGDVRLDPAHLRLARPEALLRSRQRCGGDVEHADAGDGAIQQIVHEAGIPASDVEVLRCGAGVRRCCSSSVETVGPGWNQLTSVEALLV